jgi:hypothetical protein
MTQEKSYKLMKGKTMKFLILVLTLFATSAFADLNTPPAKAACGQAYQIDVCVWAQYATGFDDEYGLRAVYLGGDNKWMYLSEKTHFITNMTTKETTDFYFQTFVDAINTQIEIKLKPIGNVEPDSGLERIKWLIGQLSFSNNQLVYSP